MSSTSSAEASHATLVLEAPRPERLLAGMRPGTLLLLFAVAAVVCIVSLPRLEAYAVATNESDARGTVRLLAQRLLATGALAGEAPGFAPSVDPVDSADSMDLSAAIDSSAWLRHRLRDVRATERASVVLHHGFHFAVVKSAGDTATVFAWPRRFGRTGRVILACGADGRVLVHPDPPAAWSGLLDPRELADVVPGAATGWRPVP